MFICLILCLAAIVRSEVVNINLPSDVQLKLLNLATRNTGKTSTIIPAGNINGDIKYSEGRLIGLDSLIRTGDCKADIQPWQAKFDIHVGFGLLVAVFGSVNVNGNEMSAFYRIRDNSIHLAFTIRNQTDCQVSLDSMHFERISKVELGTSRSDFDGLEVDKFFQANVLPVMNKVLDDRALEVNVLLQLLCGLVARDQIHELINNSNYKH